MTSVTVELLNEAGLHARPADTFIRTAQKFKCDIKIVKDTIKVDGKSILGLLTLGATKGTMITIEADGDDEKNAVDKLKQLVENKFGEDE